MTDKETLDWLCRLRSKMLIYMPKEIVNDEMYEALDTVIKALEQEPVLDKIRAEIIAKDKNVKAIRSDGCCFFTADEILNILNKYKAESAVLNWEGL